jgi:hypothetical protein
LFSTSIGSGVASVATSALAKVPTPAVQRVASLPLYPIGETPRVENALSKATIVAAGEKVAP